jgi:hypothetical protein
MLKQLQHKRFTILNESSSLRCYWYVQMQSSIEPIGTMNDDEHKRPWHIHS